MDMDGLIQKIKLFDWSELDGKTLHIRAGKQEGTMIVVGYDQESKDIFVLHEEISLPNLNQGDPVKQSCPHCRATGIHYCRSKEAQDVR